MVVDLGRSRSVSAHVYQDFMNCHIPPDLASCLNTLPVPISRKDCPFKTRFVFAYGVDNSDKPSYLLWLHRSLHGSTLHLPAPSACWLKLVTLLGVQVDGGFAS